MEQSQEYTNTNSSKMPLASMQRALDQCYTLRIHQAEKHSKTPF